ncbi:uncharacterized protein K452DRAFT_353384, partial [Aplosporella prunicola CBS 121167]
MLLCGIIDELQEPNTPNPLAYFLCQATDSRINSATAVLRGLLYLPVEQQPSLISHVRKKYDRAGQALFNDTNAWVALSEILTNILNDANLEKKYLIIDALDECTIDLPKLLDFIARNSSKSPRVKWIVSSRNQPDIEEGLEKPSQEGKLSLELNAKWVSQAVDTFISYKVTQLARNKGYDRETIQAVREHLKKNANDTFLWVVLVCQELGTVPAWKANNVVRSFLRGLDDLYAQMMRYPGALQDILSSCGSFLTVREETVYFVHQSAKDFLLTKPSPKTPNGAFDELFPSGKPKAHHSIFSRSLDVMSGTLRRDMYDLKELGYPAEKIRQPNPDPLAASRYACFYWIDHLIDSDLNDGGSVDTFLTQKYLYWLESLSLFKDMSKGIDSITKLEKLVQKTLNLVKLSRLIQDARRFIMYHKGVIEQCPLQAYASALLFSLEGSIIRRLFKEEEPRWATIKPA